MCGTLLLVAHTLFNNSSNEDVDLSDKSKDSAINNHDIRSVTQAFDEMPSSNLAFELPKKS